MSRKLLMNSCSIMIFQAPTCWSEFPEKVWIQVFQYLMVKVVGNLHLVCRNLHQIANLHVNPKLHIEENSQKSLESFVQSSRIFEELQLSGKCDVNLKCLKIFGMIEEFIGFTGIHI
jgi:hypothetical protein